ncbi:solute carrier family 2, facilitated glucose transporter member 11-like [Melozone crissalis]|uniref:solute carrier family 2, facilitated glucose transporter member 11-like n=1 Tax=Melozone crissalis TaxID=40204 RepID=UPI0023DC7F1A|nr:solute carrier family 2, facilitated glucose transporter member 11-like [Melozone crissalis]
MSYNLFLLAFVLGMTGTFHYGLQVSIINSPAEYIQSFIHETWLKRYGSSPSAEMVTLMWSLIVSIYSIGGLLGSSCAGFLCVRFGRKKAMLLSNIPALLGAALMGLSRLCGSFEMIIAGRLFSGVCGGLTQNVHIMYAGECAPRKLRGLIAITASTFSALGKFVGFALGLREVLGVEALWPVLLAANAVPVLVQFLTLPFFPDSPRYLLIDLKDKEACIKAVKQLWGDGDHMAEINDMMSEQRAIGGEKAKSVWDLLRDRAVRWQLITLLLVVSCIQLLGANVVYSYAYSIFTKAGIPPAQTHYVSLGIGTTEILSTVLCGFLIERAGRKTLLWKNYAVMALALGLLTVTLSLQDSFFWVPYCSVALVFIFIMSFGIGPGGVVCPLITEIFIQSYRPAAYVFNGVVNWIQLFILGLVFPFLVVQYRRLLLMLVVLGIGGTHLSGFQMSVINYTSPYIQKFINETWLERYGSVLPQESLMLLWSLIVSAYCMGGMIGCLCSGYLTATFGKKKSLLFNDVVLITAALLTACSRRAKAFEMILAGRFLEGIAAGIHMNAHVQYAGEISPKKLRGFINVTSTVFLALGKTVARILGLRELLGTEDMWNVLLSFSGLVALIQLIFLPFFPESPPYLLLQKEDKAGCLKAMKQLWGEGNYQREFDDLMKEKAITKGTKIMNVLEVLREGSVHPQLCTMLLLLLSLQLCGLSAITFYTSEIFETANLHESIIPYVSLGVSISELISIIFCSSIIDRFGRRLLLCGGYLLMALILVLLETSLLLSDQFLWLRYCSVILIFLFIIAYGLGPAGAVVAVMNEIFTLSARASAFVIGGIIIWLGLTFTGMVFPFAVMFLGPFCFLIFVAVLVISVVLIYLFLPETKGKSTSEITEKFKSCRFKRKHHQPVEMYAAEEKTFCTRL